MEIGEVLRRWQRGESRRAIARATGLSRNTVSKYVEIARAAGLTRDGPPPAEGLLAQLPRFGPKRAGTDFEPVTG
jgi:transposase